MPIPRALAAAGTLRSPAHHIGRLHDRRPDFKTVKTVSRVLYGTPLLDERQRRFWEWVADYYMCTLGEVMRVALPSLMKPSGHGEEEFAADEFRPRREWFVALAGEALTADGLAAAPERMGRPSPRHRDALEDKAGHQYKVVTREDPDCAQVSLVMGSSWEGWQENLKFAVAVQQHLTERYPTLMRPLTLRNSDYNEYFTPGSLLVEIGAAGNSLDEALKAVRVFGEGFAEVVTGT